MDLAHHDARAAQAVELLGPRSPRRCAASLTAERPAPHCPRRGGNTSRSRQRVAHQHVTMRVPPEGGDEHDDPWGSSRISPMRTASRPSGCSRRAASAPASLGGRNDGDELSLVRHVERVDPEQLAGCPDRRAHGRRASSSRPSLGSPASSLQTVPRRHGWRPQHPVEGAAWSSTSMRPSRAAVSTRCPPPSPGHPGPA